MIAIIPGRLGVGKTIYYTIVASARRRGIDPEAYLADVIRRIPTTPADQMHTLTPAAWAAEKKHRPMPATAPVTPAPAKPAPSAAA